MFERVLVNLIIFRRWLYDTLHGTEETKSTQLERTRIIRKGDVVELTWDCGCKPLDHRPEAHNAQIIAIDGEWFDSPSDSIPMDSSPNAERNYYIEIRPPWRLQLHQEIWIIHTPDSVCNYGWIWPQHIEDTLFCKVTVKNFLEKSEHECLVEVIVTKVVRLTEFSSLLEQVRTPSQLTNFLTHPPFDLEITQIGDHFCARWDSQGNKGETLLILKIPYSHTYFTPYYQYSCACEDFVIGGNYLVPDEIMQTVLNFKPREMPRV